MRLQTLRQESPVELLDQTTDHNQPGGQTFSRMLRKLNWYHDPIVDQNGLIPLEGSNVGRHDGARRGSDPTIRPGTLGSSWEPGAGVVLGCRSFLLPHLVVIGVPRACLSSPCSLLFFGPFSLNYGCLKIPVDQLGSAGILRPGHLHQVVLNPLHA